MRYKINLLPPKEKSLVDKIIYFALNYLRYILVITQIIVIGVFFYRFKIDQEIIDLKEELQQKQEIVLVSSPLFKQAEATDIKINEVRQILVDQETLKEMIKYLLTRFPEKIYLDKMTIQENSFKLEGFTQDIKTLRVFFEKIKKENRFKTVNLKNVKKTDFGFSFSFILEDFIYQKK